MAIETGFSEQGFRIVDVTPENIKEHPQAICFINPKQESYPIKVGWLKERCGEGLKIKLLYLGNDKRPCGFIEYVPGEFAWRSVNAEGYLFIHCIWTYGKKNQHKGIGSKLIDEVVSEANLKGKSGVAAVSSDDSFMAGREIFLKNGFKIVEESGKYQLMVKQLKDNSLPSFNDFEKELKKYKGLNIIYSNQCPWVARFIKELDSEIVDKYKIKLKELKTAKDAQGAPSIYSVFSLVYDGKILADHYISNTRFKNILKKIK